MNESVNARWLKWLLSGIMTLLAVIAFELSALIGPIMPYAQAASSESRAREILPDSALQRERLLQSQNETNAKLGLILQHLRTQTLKVQIMGTDKESKPASAPTPRPVPTSKK